jgi:hypothetical protein
LAQIHFDEIQDRLSIGEHNLFGNYTFFET